MIYLIWKLIQEFQEEKRKREETNKGFNEELRKAIEIRKGALNILRSCPENSYYSDPYIDLIQDNEYLSEWRDFYSEFLSCNIEFDLSQIGTSVEEVRELITKYKHIKNARYHLNNLYAEDNNYWNLDYEKFHEEMKAANLSYGYFDISEERLTKLRKQNQTSMAMRNLFEFRQNSANAIMAFMMMREILQKSNIKIEEIGTLLEDFEVFHKLEPHKEFLCQYKDFTIQV